MRIRHTTYRRAMCLLSAVAAAYYTICLLSRYQLRQAKGSCWDPLPGDEKGEEFEFFCDQNIYSISSNLIQVSLECFHYFLHMSDPLSRNYEMLLPSSCSNLLAEAVKRINSLVERRVQDLLDTFMNANTFELMESFVPKSLPMLGLVAVGDLVGTISTLAPTNPCKFSLAILMKAGELQVSMVRRILSITVGPVFNTLPSRSWIANKDEVRAKR